MIQDAIDPRIATDDEKAHLDEWKKYRVLVTRVDTLKPVWPKQPNSNL
ncbi:TPA: tail fiber assembly protein [Salmonella enterica subsp. enterica serovar Muenchen]|nr:tail fiber assembly protein [Salmonella enterica subsp. enterica serovar Muenchen]